MKSYLVQRAKFRDEINRNGLNNILSFDYMGSAEFEFGALPKSLKRIRENIGEYSYFEIQLDRYKIIVFCNKNLFADVKYEIVEIVLNKRNLKESCDLKYLFVKDLFCKCYNDFWWDIDNDFMFFKYNPTFLEKFKNVIRLNNQNLYSY